MRAGHRAFLGESAIEQNDPEFRNNLLFYEYFDGDTGKGLGAPHQTGWTGLVALLLPMCSSLSGKAHEVHADAAPGTIAAG